MKRFGLLLASFVILVAAAIAGEPTSAELLTKAKAQAAQEHKNVMVIFHASWCGWCKRLDSFLADKEMSKVMEDNFVIVHLDVMENGDKVALENAGGMDLMKQWDGEKAGLPFTVILDASGKKLIDSNEKGKEGGNIGYPAAPNEIAHFMKMLVESAPRLTKPQYASIKKWLTEHAPKR